MRKNYLRVIGSLKLTIFQSVLIPISTFMYLGGRGEGGEERGTGGGEGRGSGRGKEGGGNTVLYFHSLSTTSNIYCVYS